MKTIHQISILVSLPIVVIGALIYLTNSNSSRVVSGNLDSGLQSVSSKDFSAEINDADARVLIDIRTPQEYAAGHLDNAINFDFYEPTFVQQLDQLDRNEPIAIYCRSGSRSSVTLQIMKEMGFTNVTELQGGILAWQETFGETICPGMVC